MLSPKSFYKTVVFACTSHEKIVRLVDVDTETVGIINNLRHVSIAGVPRLVFLARWPQMQLPRRRAKATTR